jgi:hypothetical protein
LHRLLAKCLPAWTALPTLSTRPRASLELSTSYLTRQIGGSHTQIQSDSELTKRRRRNSPRSLKFIANYTPKNVIALQRKSTEFIKLQLNSLFPSVSNTYSFKTYLSACLI